MTADYGQPLSYFDIKLTPTRARNPNRPPVVGIKKKFSAHLDWFRGAGWKLSDWSKCWSFMPVSYFSAFTPSDLVRLWKGANVSSSLCRWMEGRDEHPFDPKLFIFRKLENSLWRWGWSKNWNLYVLLYNRIRTFDFGIEGFSVTLDYSTYYNEYGYSHHARVYLDAPFAYLVHYKGKHVLTLSFAPCRDGILLSQIQLKNKKGNRWTYKLPLPYRDYCVSRMWKMCGRLPLFFVRGESMVTHLRKSYGRRLYSSHPDWSRQSEGRIKHAYNRPLLTFRRVREHVRANGMIFDRLIKR